MSKLGPYYKHKKVSPHINLISSQKCTFQLYLFSKETYFVFNLCYCKSITLHSEEISLPKESFCHSGLVCRNVTHIREMKQLETKCQFLCVSTRTWTHSILITLKICLYMFVHRTQYKNYITKFILNIREFIKNSNIVYLYCMIFIYMTFMHILIQWIRVLY